ncbi:MAG: hypothetical protein JSS27_05370 [Planctomycetes bacterium]|nr:hypothetical protein [Planctomycetota bacterium]
MPKQGPHCGDPWVSATHVAAQYQTGIPRAVINRQFNVQFGRCDVCGRTVAGHRQLFPSQGLFRCLAALLATDSLSLLVKQGDAPLDAGLGGVPAISLLPKPGRTMLLSALFAGEPCGPSVS